MKKHSKILILSCICLLFLFLSGCWDRSEVERESYVIAIGLDENEQKGKVNVTYLIANAEVGTALTVQSEEDPVEMITVRASGLISARNIANAVVSREISYDLLRVILVSEELAKQENFIRLIYGAMKDKDIRRNTYLVVTKEKTSEFFAKNDPKMETRPHKFYQYMIERGSQTGLIPPSELHHFFRITEEDANAFLAIYATTTQDEKANEEHRENELDFLAGDVKLKGRTNASQFMGSAVLLEGKMIGTLTGQETRVAMMLNGRVKIPDILTTLTDPFNEKFQLTLRLNKYEKNKIKMNLEKDRPRIDLTIPLVVDVLTDYSMTNYADDQEKVEKLRRSLEKQLEERVMDVVEKTQNELKAEPFGWSINARKQFLTLREYMDFDWMKTYPEMEVNVDVEIHFGEFGRQPELPGLQGIKD